MMAGENLGLHKNEEYWEWLKKMMSRLGQSHLDPEAQGEGGHLQAREGALAKN